MIRLYLDEDSSSRALLAALRRLGVDVTSAVEAGMRTKSDPEHLAYAASSGLTICTRNVRDFARLHSDYLSQERPHSGIIILPAERYSLGQKARGLALITAALRSKEMHNQLEYLTGWL